MRREGKKMNKVLCFLFGYFIGTINPAYLLGKMKGMDIRTQGSGNAGASNAVILMGKTKGALCALFDISKAFLVYKIARRLFPIIRIAGLLAACGCILGHIFPIWMKFRGGKGLACLAGMILAYDWKIFCMLLLAEIAIVLIVDYICMEAITGSMMFPVVYMVTGGEPIGIWLLAGVALVIVFKHLENIKRIKEGKELHLSYLWNKDKEIERLKQNMH